MTNNTKYLNFIFNDITCTEEQKAVMISSLSNIIPDNQLTNGQLSHGHQMFFMEALKKAGFVFMENYFKIANDCAQSTPYLLKVLNSLSDNQKRKYAMLFILFINDCRSRNDNVSNMSNIMVLILEAIGIDKVYQKSIETKMYEIT